MFLDVHQHSSRIAEASFRRVVTWALSVGAERRLQCGDVEYRAPSRYQAGCSVHVSPRRGDDSSRGLCFVVPTHMCCVRRFGPSFRADADESPLENSDDP